MFAIAQLSAQNLHFTSACDAIVAVTSSSSCEAEVLLEVAAISDDTCTIGPGVIDYTYTAIINDGGTVTQLNGNGNTVLLKLPKGNHQLNFVAQDGCTGDTAQCIIPIEVKDLEGPIAYCHVGVSTISVPISPGGYIDIWASDFDLGSEDNCTEPSQLRFSFSDDPTDRTIRRTCDDVTGLLEDHTIHIWDEAGNYSTCDVRLLLGDCTNDTQLDGKICLFTETGEYITNATIETSCQAQIEYNSTCYDFLLTNQGPLDCVLTPVKDINPLNGVSTFDLVLIHKHILGSELFDSPYKMLAADVSNSGKITLHDLVILRKLILFQLTSFPNNTSWRFVNADFIFPDPTNPFLTSLPESLEINSSINLPISSDFIGYKVGDVNNSAQPFTNTPSEDRSYRETLPIGIADQKLTAGESYTIDFSTKDFESIAGFQFALQVDTDALRFEQLHTNNALDYFSEGNFGLEQLAKGLLPVSWNSFEGTDLKDGTPLFSLRFTALQDGTLSDWLGIQESLLTAEAYEENGTSIDLMNVALQFEDVVNLSSAFQVEAAQPNPFAEGTSIAFKIQQPSRVKLLIYNLAGQLVYKSANTYETGRHTFEIDGIDLGAKGVYYYQVHSPLGTSNGSLIRH